MIVKTNIVNTVKIKRFHFVLDWYDIDDVEIDLDKFVFFEMQFRCGSWYLLHYVYEDKKFRQAYEYDFELFRPKQALKTLGKKVNKFSALHGGGKIFNKQLFLLLKEAK